MISARLGTAGVVGAVRVPAPAVAAVVGGAVVVRAVAGRWHPTIISRGYDSRPTRDSGERNGTAGGSGGRRIGRVDHPTSTRVPPVAGGARPARFLAWIGPTSVHR